MYVFNGISITISPDLPRMQCSEAFKRLQAPELVAETNLWLASFFGFTNIVKDGEAIKIGDRSLIMSPRTLDQLQKATS